MHQYSRYVTSFREDAARTGIFEYKGGLNYVFRHLLSAVPAAIGHLIDTVLGLDGLILSDRDSHFSGPFGLLLGVPFWVLGAVVGQILQIVLSLPACIGYYLLDKPISFLVKGFDRIMSGNLEISISSPMSVKIVGTLAEILSTIYRVYVYLTQGTPNEMQGLFGFIFGIVPQTGSYALTRLGATTVSVVRFLTDGACEGVRALYSKIKHAVSASESAPEPKPAPEPTCPPASEPEPISKRRKIRRPAGKDTVTNEIAEELKQAIDNKIDLFAALGITLQEYNQGNLKFETIWRSKTLSCHPDKFPHDKYPDKKQEWDNLALAKTILGDAQSALAKDYVKWYQSTIAMPSIANNPASFLQPKQDAAQSVAQPSDVVQDGKSTKRIIRKRK